MDGVTSASTMWTTAPGEKLAELARTRTRLRRLRAELLRNPLVADIVTARDANYALVGDQGMLKALESSVSTALASIADVVLRGPHGECVRFDLTLKGEHSGEPRSGDGPGARRVVELLEAALPRELLGAIALQIGERCAPFHYFTDCQQDQLVESVLAI